MNTPGKQGGNWGWRMSPEHFDESRFDLVKRLTAVYGRKADPDFVL
jgi:4-alpha-glucanotransferase